MGDAMSGQSAGQPAVNGGPIAPTRPADVSAQAAGAAIGGPGAPPAGPEADLWSARTSWKYFTGRMAFWLLAMGALAAAIGWITSRTDWLSSRTATLIVAALVALSGVVLFGGIALRVLSTKYRLTSQRLFIMRGILSQTTDQTELIRVDDVRLYMTLLGRILKVGTVTVITTDATDRTIQIEGVSDPTTVAEAIRGRMRALRGKSVYVETL